MVSSIREGIFFIGIELRSRVEDKLWRSFFDVVFGLASILLAIVFGAALGNVIRGVPLNAEGYFFEPLWTNWRVGVQNGILDWYTVTCGLVALVTLVVHGSLYLVTKTEGYLNSRAWKVASSLWPVQILLTIFSLIATVYVVQHALDNYRKWPIGYLAPVIVIASLVSLRFAHSRGNEKRAFLASCAYIVGMLVGAAFAIYPNVLPASTGPQYSLTIYNAATGAYGLGIGVVWWTLGIILALGYLIFSYRMFRGKVNLGEAGQHEY
jgi:cytochrome d ubiquinol oxidase subunit II